MTCMAQVTYIHFLLTFCFTFYFCPFHLLLTLTLVIILEQTLHCLGSKD